MKGIILAGGTGSRLWPLTKAVSKQLLPVHDKPMIYYPLGTLMLAGIRDFAVISTPADLPRFQMLLGDGRQWGISIEFLEQSRPRGIADAFLVASGFLGGHRAALALGDNILHGPGLGRQLAGLLQVDGAHIFGYQVSNPEQYGVVCLDESGLPIDLIEKPKTFVSSLAIPGLYFYDNDVVQLARTLTPSERGELEVTDLNMLYLQQGRLSLSVLERGTAWLDAGTAESLHDASTYVRVIEQRQGLKVGCVEEIAWRNGWISNEELLALASKPQGNLYGDYLRRLVEYSRE